MEINLKDVWSNTELISLTADPVEIRKNVKQPMRIQKDVFDAVAARWKDLEVFDKNQADAYDEKELSEKTWDYKKLYPYCGVNCFDDLWDIASIRNKFYRINTEVFRHINTDYVTDNGVTRPEKHMRVDRLKVKGEFKILKPTKALMIHKVNEGIDRSAGVFIKNKLVAMAYDLPVEAEKKFVDKASEIINDKKKGALTFGVDAANARGTLQIGLGHTVMDNRADDIQKQRLKIQQAAQQELALLTDVRFAREQANREMIEGVLGVLECNETIIKKDKEMLAKRGCEFSAEAEERRKTR